MAYPPVYPHDPIEPIAEDLFMARGSVKMNPIVRITRNMGIVRHNGELTLLNPVRLNDAELKNLEALGTVRHIVRVGAFHGMDDPFYQDRYKAEFWCQEGAGTYSVPAIDHAITEQTELPFGNARIVCFNGVNQPECAITVATDKKVLFTADSIQHYGDYSNCNFVARLMMPRIGFPKTTLVGPIWLRVQTPEGGDLRGEFDRLLGLDFDALLSAHGTFLASGAHAAVERAVATAFADS